MFNLLVIGFFIFITSLLFGGGDKKKNVQSGNRQQQFSGGVPSLDASLTFIIACTMLSDGKATQNELKAVKKYLLKNFGEANAKSLLLKLRDRLKALEADGTAQDIRPYCIRINQQMTYGERLALLSTLFQISIADGNICEQEATLLQLYARFTRISTIDFLHMQTYYTYGYEWKEQQDQRGRRQQQQTQQQSTLKDRSWALKVLGLTENATEKDIKKAFRTAALQYHPDKQVGASEDQIKKNTEKFREINEAYNLLTKK